MDTKTTQQQEFDTALAGLTPEQRATYTKANPIVGVGGVQQSYSQGNYSPVDTTFAATNIGNVQPMKISPSPTSTTAAGFGAELTSLAQSETESMDKQDALNAETEAARIKAETAKTSSKKSFLDFLGGRKGESELTNQAYSETNTLGTNVDETAKRVREINNKINAVDIRTQEQIKQLEKNPNGLFGGALQNEINRVNKDAASSKADLYIDKLMAQGDYDSAKSIADRKVNMLMEQDKLEYEKLMFDYTENKDLFTKAEQREFELAADDRKRKLDAETETRKTFEKTKIDLAKSAAEQGAPQSVKDAISKSTTVEQAINAAGIYAGDIRDRELKKAQAEKLYAEAGDKNASNGAISRVAKVNPDSPTYIQDMIAASAGGANLTGEQTKPIFKALTVIGQIDSLQATLKNVDTGPILGILKSANPYDVQAQLVKGQLQAIIPNLARGVYGEVGVLTDNDIANYRKTLGNLRSTEELNDLLLSMTLKTVLNGINDQLEVAASAGRDVSGFKNLHERITSQVSQLNAKIGITDEKSNPQATDADTSYVNSLKL